MAQMNLSTEKKFRDLENRVVVARGGGWRGAGSGMDWEFGVNRCRPLPLEWTGNEILLYSTGNYIYSLKLEHDNVRKKNVYMFV